MIPMTLDKCSPDCNMVPIIVWAPITERELTVMVRHWGVHVKCIHISIYGL
jgi:hypothetical protein